jgi:hypothetical protein
MNELEYKQFYDKVGKINGWDFSNVKLTHTPIIPSFGENELDYRILYPFVLDNQTDKGIKTNAARFVITARL